MIKHFLSDLNSVKASAWAFLFIGIPALGYLFSTDFTERLQQTDGAWKAMGYITILGVVGSALSVIVFNILIKRAGPVFASTCTYLIPIVAVFWGFLDGESIQLTHFAGIGVILTGIWLVNKKL